jgi:glycosyltransferase involved in cell wall biosynthesis
MACGSPIVAHDSPRLRWIVGEGEYLVDTDDPANVALGLKRAQQAPESDRQGRVENAARFSWSKVGELYRDFLTEVVAKTRSGQV